MSNHHRNKKQLFGTLLRGELPESLVVASTTLSGFAAAILVNVGALPGNLMPVALSLLFLSLAYFVLLAFVNTKKLDSLFHDSGVSVRHYDVEPLENDDPRVIRSRIESAFRVITDIVSNAEKWILVLNSYTEERPWKAEGGGHNEDIRKIYFDALESKINKSNTIEYKRVLQVDDFNASLGGIFYSTYLDHFKATLNQIEEDTAAGRYGTFGSRVELQMCEPRYPSTLMIVDDRWIIWQLYVLEGSKSSSDHGLPRDSLTTTVGEKVEERRGRYRMRSIVVMEDKTGTELVPRFRAMFDRAKADADKNGAPVNGDQLS